MPSPYIRDQIRAINQISGIFCHASYYTAMSSDREWDGAELEPWERVLKGGTMRWLGSSAHINPGISPLLAADDSDLVVVMDYSAPTAQIAMRALSNAGRPWVFWGERPGMRDRGKVGKIVRRFLQRPIESATAVVGMGSRASRIYRTLFPGKKVFNIPYLCDLQQFISAESKTAGDEVTFLFAGQFIERKGVDLLAGAFSRLAVEDRNVRLVWCGGGSLRLDLERQLRAFSDRVFFPGFLQGKELAQKFASADVFVLPSRHDGWGVVVNEALGTGLPLILSDAVGAADDLLEHTKNGLLVPSGDEDALYGAMKSLSRSADLRAKFSARSREMRELWTPDEGARRWLAVCRDVLGGGTFQESESQ